MRQAKGGVAPGIAVPGPAASCQRTGLETHIEPGRSDLQSVPRHFGLIL